MLNVVKNRHNNGGEDGKMINVFDLLISIIP